MKCYMVTIGVDLWRREERRTALDALLAEIYLPYPAMSNWIKQLCSTIKTNIFMNALY